MVIATVAPLGSADDTTRAWALAAVAGAAPSERVVLLTVAPEDLRGGSCERALPGVLDRGHARAALVLEPADGLCGIKEGKGGAPVVALPLDDLRLRGTTVVGFEATSARSLGALGISSSPWVVPRAARSVPAVALRDLESGAVPASVLADRVALVAVGAAAHLPLTAAPGEAPPPAALAPGDSAAATLGGLLEGGGRDVAPVWAAPLYVLAAGALIRLASRRGQAMAAAAFAVLVAALVFGQALLAARLTESLLPSASALLGLLFAFAGIVGTRAVRKAFAVGSAAEALERGALHRMQSVHTLPDADFWLRVARLAGQSHPCDAVLVADLPSGEWDLRFWNDRQGGELLVAERRRDVRRAPFSNEEGVPKLQVIQGFLAREDVPVVGLPLIASGDVEGYVFLCGASAESAFTRDPERTERLARELALLARRRRLARRFEAEGRPLEAAGNLLDSAQVALGDLRLLGAALRGAPVELLVADAFGDVRFVSQELAAWLKGRELTVPPEGPGGALVPGDLALGDVLAAAKGAIGEGRAGGKAAAQMLARVMEREEGLDIPVGGPEPGVLHVRVIRQEADGVSWIGGYVATLSRMEQSALASANVRTLGARESVDPLCAFALGELVTETVTASARSTGRTLKLEPIRGPVHALGHRGELAQALEAFLVDMSSRALPGHQPAISVRETPQGAQLSILDVGFGLGLPESALERVLIAPNAAPAGLESLGRLILAAEDSHGQAELRTNDGWGITLVVTLLRGHPRLSAAAPEAGRISTTPNVIALGRKQG